MPEQFTVIPYEDTELGKPIVAEFVQHDDNLFLLINGKSTYASLWFIRIPDPDRIVVKFGQSSEITGEWEELSDIAISEED